nr:hypothetical protein [Tanacetum cinerariifolium]
MEVFIKILQICPKLSNQEFDALPSEEEIVSFIKELGHKGDTKSVTDMVVDQMYQPWRTFASIINKCLSGKITALLPEVMTSQKMRDSPAYKTYLAFATGAASPKKIRKYKKLTSLSRKRTLVIVEEEEPEPAKKVVASKKLSRKQSIGDSGDEANIQGDDEDVQDSDDDPQQADDERTNSENQETNDDEEEFDNEFVHTPKDYVPTKDETNDESNDFNKEEYDKIDKELYGDVNVRLTDDEQDDKDLEKKVKELKNVDHSLALLLKIKSKVSNTVKESLRTRLDDGLYKVLKKHADIIKEFLVPKTTLFNTMTNSKSFNKSPKHRALYQALMELILEDEDVMDEGVADKLKRRKPDDADQDEGFTTGSDRGLKRQRTSKGAETYKKMSTSKDSFKGKSPSTSSKSSKSGKYLKDQVEEPIFVQDSGYAKHDDAEFDNTNMPMDQGEDLGKTSEQPNDEDVSKYDWYKKSRSDTSSDPEWNEGKNLSLANHQNFYRYTTKMVSKHGVYLTKRILSVISVKVNEWYDGYSKEIVVKRADQQLYTFKEGDFKRLHLNDIEDMLLLVVQNKLNNLDGNVIVHLTVSLCMFARKTLIQARVEDLQVGVESYQKKLNLTKTRTQDVDISCRPAYTTLSNPQGVIYEDKLK